MINSSWSSRVGVVVGGAKFEGQRARRLLPGKRIAALDRARRAGGRCRPGRRIGLAVDSLPGHRATTLAAGHHARGAALKARIKRDDQLAGAGSKDQHADKIFAVKAERVGSTVRADLG